MFNCNNCKNKEVCKNIETANKIKYEIKELQKKYKDFYGCILAYCDYFIESEKERNRQG